MFMKARNLLWITVVNIFLLLLFSVVLEYSDLNSRFRQLENIVSTATDTAIRTSTASEELFSNEYKSNFTTSKGTNSGKNNITSTLKVLSKDGNSWVDGNTYVMAKYYNENSHFPNNQRDYNNFYRDFKTDEDIYSWLFGGVGSSYNNYVWANSGTKLWHNEKLIDYNGKSRQPTNNFKDFYDAIGYKMKSETYVKEQMGYDSFNVVETQIPTLAQMGLTLDGVNDTTSNVTNDYLSSSVHLGKSKNGISDTTYYLTPYSLGVTYVPTEVLKPAFASHLEQLVRFNKVKHTVTNSSGDLEDFASANGCISTEVYADGSNAQHKARDGSKIINDGVIEYDLSTIKVKVDYFYVDFYDINNYKIVNKIEGATSNYDANGNVKNGNSSLFTDLPNRLKERDTSYDKSGYRIVAKVSVKLKVHIPYKSSILQWFRYKNADESKPNHYDVRRFDADTDSTDNNADGVWFYYSTYTAVSR